MDRNFILAIALSLGVILLWDLLIAGPQREEMQAAREAAQELEELFATDEQIETR